MPFDDLPLLAKILITVVGPPIVTIVCWLVARFWRVHGMSGLERDIG